MSQLQKNKENGKKQEQFCGGNYLLIPLLIVIGILPLIMRAYVYDTGLNQYAWYLSLTDQIDIFLRNKAIVLCIIALVMAVILIILLVKNHRLLAGAYWVIPLVTYGVLTLLSTLFSLEKEYGFKGTFGQFESVWVILSYCVLTLYAYIVIRSDNDLLVVRKALFFVLVVLGIIGLLQMSGHDFFATDVGRDLITPDKYGDLKENLTFKFAGSKSHQVYLTFYNPNYVGVFGALVLPITVMLAVAAKNIKKKAAWSILTLVTFISVLGCGSKTFLLSLFVSALAALIFCRKIIRKHYKAAIGGILICVICGGIYFGAIGLNVFTYVKNALTLRPNNYEFQDLEIYEDHAEITYKGNKLNMQVALSEDGESTVLKFADEAGNTLQGGLDKKKKIVIEDERFEGLTFEVKRAQEPLKAGVTITNGNHAYTVAMNENGYYFFNNLGKVDVIGKPETAVFTDYCSFASGRGYIWSRTIPLLKDSILLGTGADSYTVVFPQNDYIGRSNAGYASQILTKPHNLYLQIGVQHGVLALICFLAVCVMYLLQSFRLYLKADLSDGRNLFGIGIMMGILGYLFAGLSNDSCVALAPLFWVMIGIGFAVNRRIVND